jgi:hypothetical protein
MPQRARALRRHDGQICQTKARHAVRRAGELRERGLEILHNLGGDDVRIWKVSAVFE